MSGPTDRANVYAISRQAYRLPGDCPFQQSVVSATHVWDRAQLGLLADTLRSGRK